MNALFPEMLPPTILQKKIAEIENSALNNTSANDLLRQIRILTVGYVTSTSSVNGAYFRGRKDASSPSFRTIDELWYPPAAATPQGRVNELGRPVFYCSDSHETATREADLAVDERITVLKCLLKNSNVAPHVFCIGAVKRIVRTGQNIFGKKVDPAFDFRKYPRPVREGSLLIDGFFSRVFTSSDRKYFNLTNAIAKQYMAGKEIDGLVYPSVRLGGGLNLALKAESADRLLSVESIFSARLSRKLNGNRLLMRRDYLAGVRANRSLMWYRAVDV